MYSYYSQKLSAERLRLCYEIAPPRVKRYLEAEIEFVFDRTKSSDLVLELGCGYGRVLQKLMTKAKAVVGIDTSLDSLRLARALFGRIPVCHLLAMNAVALGFRHRQFDKDGFRASTLRKTNWSEFWPTERIIWTMIHHDIYHGAQIQAVRKILRGTEPWPLKTTTSALRGFSESRKMIKRQ